MNRYDDLVQNFAMFIPDSTTGEDVMQFACGEDLERPEHVSEKQLRQAEAQIGYSLPTDYREFLSDYGTLISPTSLTFPTDEGLSVGFFSVFYGIATNGGYDLVNCNQEIEKALPVGLIKIATGDNGYWCLSTAGDAKGTVFFWDSQAGGNTKEYENIHFIAQSFDDFLHLLAEE